MKKATTHKKKKTKTNNDHVDMGTAKILRTVGDQEAFYFYEAFGKPTGEIARNLSDFLEKVKSVKSESLMFHLQRSDFQNWVEKILGDSKLARKLARISSSNSDDIRLSIYKAVENRITELREPSITILVGENSTVLVPSS